MIKAMECEQQTSEKPNALREAMRFFDDETMLWNHPEEDAVENLRNVIRYFAATNPYEKWLAYLDRILFRLQFLTMGSGFPSEADDLGPNTSMPKNLQKPYHPNPALMEEEIIFVADFMHGCRCFHGKPEWDWFLGHLQASQPPDV